jgi:DNA-binding CsgD family transcriptional regulator
MSQYSIERFIEDTNKAKSSTEATRIFERALAYYGYDRFCYSLITAHPSVGLGARHGVARNYPDDWMAHYEANQYEKKDPVRQYGLTTCQPFTWDSLGQARNLKPEQQRVMDEAREAGLLDGIAVPIWGQNGELAGVGMASSTGGVRPDINLLSKIRALTLQFHLVYTELEKKAPSLRDNFAGNIHLTAREKEILRRAKLTPREVECLKWAADGKTEWEIAAILNVSEHTADKHLANAHRKLGAASRAQAVAHAIRWGLIS